MASIRPYHREPGKAWAVTIALGKGPNGRYQRKTVIVTAASARTRGTYPDLHARTVRQVEDLVPTLEARVRGEVHVGLPLAEIARRWIAEAAPSLKPTTAHGYVSIVERLADTELGRTPIADLTAGQIGTQLRSIEKGRGEGGISPATMNRYLNVIRLALGWAVLNDLMAHNPAKDTKLPKQGKRSVGRPAADDIDKMAAVLRESHPWLLVFWLLAGQTGMRRGELVGLRWRDIDLEVSQIKVTHSVDRWKNLGDTKTHQARTVPLTTAAVALLDGWRQMQLADVREASGIDVAPSPDWFLFADPDDPSKPRSPDTVTHTLLRLRRKHGIGRVWAHGLRHDAASKMILAGHDAVSVAAALGHSSPAVTLDVYGHSNDAAVRGAIEALAPQRPSIE